MNDAPLLPLRVAVTRDERREAVRQWDEVRRAAVRIRDAYERGEERQVRARIGGSRAHVDSELLFAGPRRRS